MAQGVFDPNVFQIIFQQGVPVHDVASTAVLQNPVDCVLAGQQRIGENWRECEVEPMRRKTKTSVSTTGVRCLKGPPPSYTTRTTRRGYD